jgi:hypothetical protein
LDRLDLEDNPKLYKVDQLMAMRWAKRAWMNMQHTVIANCWGCTGLSMVTTKEEEGEEVTIEETEPVTMEIEEGIWENYAQLIAQAGIREAMSIDNFLSPVEEKEVLEEIEMMDVEEYLLQTAEREGENMEQDEVEDEVEESLYLNLLKEEQVRGLAMAVAVLDGRDMSTNKAAILVEGLRGVQPKIRWEEKEAQQAKLIQRSITHYFNQ